MAKLLTQNSNCHKGLELWAKSINDFGNFGRHFPCATSANPRSNVCACAAADGAICSKSRKIVPYHCANPNTRNSARLRSPSLIMALASTLTFCGLLGPKMLRKNQDIRTICCNDCTFRSLYGECGFELSAWRYFVTWLKSSQTT